VNSRTFIEKVFNCNSGSTKIIRGTEFWKRRSNFYRSHELADHQLEFRIRKDFDKVKRKKKDNKESPSVNLKLWDIQVYFNNKYNNNKLILAAFPYYEKQLLVSSYLAVRPHVNLGSTERMFMEFDI
jgi:hypothetical protein